MSTLVFTLNFLLKFLNKFNTFRFNKSVCQTTKINHLGFILYRHFKDKFFIALFSRQMTHFIIKGLRARGTT